MASTAHAGREAGATAALASAVSAIVALLSAPGEHLPSCPHGREHKCSTLCHGAKLALEAGRAVLFPWTVRRVKP